MRALFVCPGLGLGGAERQWASLLPALAAPDLEVRLLALNEEGPVADDLRGAGIAVACARMRGRGDVPGLRRAFGAAGRQVDVVVTRSVNAHVVGSAVAYRARAAHVATEHSQYDLLPLRRHQRLLVRAAARRVEAAVCVSSAQIPPLVELGYPRDRITLVPNAVRREALACTRGREATRRELGVPAGAFVAVMLAALRPEKQPLDFVEAVASAHACDPRIHGVLVGDGSERPAVDAACAATGGAVSAVGSRRDVGDVVHAADVICLTSRAEVLPVALLEALAVGRPVVATRVGGVPEIVRPGYNGDLVACGDVARFADTLVRLARDPEGVERMGEAARRLHQERFSIDWVVERYKRTLEAAIEARHVRRVGAAASTVEGAAE